MRKGRRRRLTYAVVAVSSVLGSLFPVAGTAAGPPSTPAVSGTGAVASLSPTFPPPQARPQSPSKDLPESPVPLARKPAAGAAVAAAAPAELWTPFSHSTRNPDGSYTSHVTPDPSFRRNGQGWAPLDKTVQPRADPALPFSAEGTVRPVRFGTSSSRLVELELDGGPVILSADGLTAAVPTPGNNGVLYSGVASNTDLRYSVSPSGVKEEITLKSAQSPTSYTFHIADPKGQLGAAHAAKEGGYQFDTVIDGAVGLGLGAPFAYEPPVGTLPPVHDLGSAHMTVTKEAKGFAVTLSVDPKWLQGKVFPLILDPSWNFNEYGNFYGVDGSGASDCNGNCRPASSGQFYMSAATYTGNGYDYEPSRSFVQYNLTANGIPQGSQVVSATWNAFVIGCFGAGTDYFCNQHSYTEELHALTAPGISYSTYNQLAAQTSGSAFASITQGPFNCAGACFWQTWQMTSTVQGWVNDPQSNYGFSAQLSPESYNIGGPAWDYTEASPPPGGGHPYLAVTWNPAPSAPSSASAAPGDQQASVTWGPANANGGTLDHYVIQVYDGYGRFTGMSTTACGGCTNAVVSPLPNYNNFSLHVSACNTANLCGAAVSSNTIVTGPVATITKAISPTQAVYSQGQQVSYAITVTNPRTQPIWITSIRDTLPNVGGALQLALLGNPLGNPPVVVTQDSGPCTRCGVSVSDLSLGAFWLAAGASTVISYPAVVTSVSGRACSLIASAVSLVSDGGNPTASVSIPSCDVGLGYESWWSYVNQDLGANGKASVNVANGNLVVQTTDATPVQAHGRFAYVLRRTYNSQDTANQLSTPALAIADAVPIGAGWRLNLDQLGAGVGDGATPAGLAVPDAASILNAYDVTLVDEDGTHHVYTPNAITAGTQLAPLSVSTLPPTGALGSLVPRVLAATSGYNSLCVDETFTEPAGVHLSLWRYVEVNAASSSSCSPVQGTTPLVLGFAAMRPDRVRYEFSADGHLLDATDGAGAEMKYAYQVQPVPGVALGHLLAVYEAPSCALARNPDGTPMLNPDGSVILTPAGTVCRALRFAYPSTTETKVTDPGGRTVRYQRNSSNQLVNVINVEANTVYQYTYGSACQSVSNQLCSASYSDMSRSNNQPPSPPPACPVQTQPVTCFTYEPAVVVQGLQRLTKFADRMGNVTTLTYDHPTSSVAACGTTTTDYVTADRGNHRQRFECFDAAGSVGEIDAGRTDDAQYLHQTLNFWDTNGQSSCIQPQAAPDHDLCRSFQYTMNGAQSAADTRYLYNPEGQTLSQASCVNAGDPAGQYPPPTGCQLAVTTNGYQAEIQKADGSSPMLTTADTVNGYGSVSSSPRPTVPFLYVISDRTSSLTPNGNAAGGGFRGYLTSYVVDNNPNASPNIQITSPQCSSAVAPPTPCASNPAINTPNNIVPSYFCPGTATNSGLVCEADSPLGKTARNEYDNFGQKVTMTTPNAVAPSVPSSYYYQYYADTALDLSNSVSAGGWLQGVADPSGNFVAYAYDQGGNQARTWDRNATGGKPRAAGQTAITSFFTFDPNNRYTTGPNTPGYSEVLHAARNAYPARYMFTWRFVLSSSDALGDLTSYTRDQDGNPTTQTPPRGNVAPTSHQYDITQTFDANDELLSTQTPATPATVNTWDAFGNKVSTTAPSGASNGGVTTYQYDTVNRLTSTAWTRAPWPRDSSTVPPAYRQSNSGDAPMVPGRIVVSTTVAYDGVDNKTATSDGNAQVTAVAYDSLHRTLQTVGPRQVNGAGTTTAAIYDLDGNALWACSPREFSESDGSRCSGPGPYKYSTQKAYDALDRLTSSTTYRDLGAQSQPGFSGPQRWSTTATSGTRGTFTGDVNGDGKADVVAVGETSTSVMLSTGSGFSAPQQWSGSPFYGTRGTFLADVNGDGKADLVAVNESQTYVMLSTGTGFAPATLWANIAFYGSKATLVADVTGDGKADVVAVNTTGSWIMASNGSSFAYPTMWSGTAFYGSQATLAADVSGDGKADLVAVNNPGISVMTSTGSSFAYPASWSSASVVGSVATLMGDVNSDGKADLMAVSGSSTSVALSTGSSLAAAQLWSSTPFNGSRATVAGDVNGDGRADLVAVNTDGSAFVILAGTPPGGPAQLTAEVTSYGYDGDGNRTTEKAPTSGSTTNTTTYDLLDRKRQQTVWRSSGASNTTSWLYDASGNLTSTTLPDGSSGRVTAYGYDPANRLTDTVSGSDNVIAKSAGTASSDGSGNVRTRQLYDADSHVVAQLDPRAFTATGSVTTPDPTYMVRTDFDANGRPTAQWVPRYDSGSHSDLGAAFGSSTQGSQCGTNPAPQAVAGVPGYPSGVGVCVSRLRYDVNGNRAQLTLPTSNGSDNRTASYSYTDDNLLRTISAPNPNSNGSQEAVQTNFYDGDGKAVLQKDALGLQTVTAYNPDETVARVTNQPNGSVAHVTSTTYDANGKPLTATDGSGNVTTMTYYSDGLVASLLDGAGDRTTYGYDGNGNQTVATSPSANAGDASNSCREATLNSYSLDNLLLSTSVPFECGNANAFTTYYAYDAGGRKVSQDVQKVNYPSLSPIADGGTQSFSYFKDDRLQQETGRLGDTISSLYDPAGNKTQIRNGSSTVTSTYYLDGRTRTVNDGSQTSQYAYDGLGTVAVRAQVPGGGGGTSTTYSYGDAELPVGMGFIPQQNAPTQNTQYGYDQDGRPLTETAPNSQVTTWAFSPDNTLQSQTLKTSGGSTLAQWTYAYNSNYLQTQQTFSGAAAPGGSLPSNAFTYGYDGANRLTALGYGGTSQSISWDHNGNRLSYARASGGPATTFSYSANNSISATTTGNQAAVSYSYDAAARTSADGCATYTYDGFDRMTAAGKINACPSVNNATSAYDGLDRRVSQSNSAGSTQFHFDGLSSTMAQESTPTSANGTVTYELNARGVHEAVNASAGQNAGLQFLTTDGQGSISTSSTAQQAIACTARFDPFGGLVGTPSPTSPTCNTGSTANDNLYHDARRDGDTGQYQFGSRLYDPSKAAFLTPDSYRTGAPTTNPSVGKDPLTANTYSYVNGDPVNLVDPNGHRACADTGCYQYAMPQSSTKNTVLGYSNQQLIAAEKGHDKRMMQLYALQDDLAKNDPNVGLIDSAWFRSEEDFARALAAVSRLQYERSSGQETQRYLDAALKEISGYTGYLTGGVAGTTAFGLCSFFTGGIGDATGACGTLGGLVGGGVAGATRCGTSCAYQGGMEGAAFGYSAGPATRGAAGATDTAAADGSFVVGRSGSPIDIAPGTNAPTEINGTQFSGHALDQMQGRGIPPSVVQNTIDQGVGAAGRGGATVYYDSVNNVSVVVSSSGRVITVYPGGG